MAHASTTSAASLPGERRFTGLPVSGGIAMAPVRLLGSTVPEVTARVLAMEETGPELERLHAALAVTRRQLEAIQTQVAGRIGARDAEIFEAHLLVLEDVVLLDEIRRAITEQRVNAEAAVDAVINRYASALAAVGDEYLRERAADVRDIGHRLVRVLDGAGEPGDLSTLREPCILVAHDLSPSTTAQIDRRMVLGFATEVGGKTSHTAILARKLGIPAVVGVHAITRSVRNGEQALLDGFSGQLIAQPTEHTLFQYGQLRQRRVAFEERLRSLRDQPAVTLDGHRLLLAANIESPADMDAVSSSGAEGVGLFRTEFLFLNQPKFPDEEAQYRAYRTVAEAAGSHEVILRTLDLGGDKLPVGQSSPEPNPFLGWRAIRICLDQPEVFKTQLRAMLRASAHGRVGLLYPMIASLEELLAANSLLEESRSELRRKGQPFDETLEVGVMIEIPSAALIADTLAEHCQFFSIGSNDLTGYTLAVDRLNERVAGLYAPTHPGVLRLMQMTIAAALRRNRWVGVCGEMAGDPLLVPLLVGLGVHELSVTPASLPAVKYLVRRIRLSDSCELAKSALAARTSAETLKCCEDYVRAAAPELLVRGGE
ncbi:MAG: phosphoenolpyruvate--protein phosphotransferase [Pedosphaera sp.]|nr:phosphoenolpyruvate--protein phosphotransferase [Pedosphaera sp.]